MSDPNNPIARVKEAHVNFTAIYKGDMAWNQDVLVPILAAELRARKWDIRDYHLDKAYDKDGNEITEDEMRQYIYRLHGHDGTHGCSNCPDPLKWKEVEKLRLKEYYKNKEVFDDMRRGHPPKGYNWATGEFANKIVYVLETQEERDSRLKAEHSKSQKVSKSKNGNSTTDKKTTAAKPDFDFEPKLQL